MQGDSYHNNGHCYKCQVCGQALSGRKVSRVSPGHLLCSSQCGRVSSVRSGRSGRYSQMSSTESDGGRSYLREWAPIPRLDIQQ